VRSEKRQDAAFFFRRLIFERALGPDAELLSLAGLGEAFLGKRHAHHVEGLIRCAFHDASEFVDDLNRQLMCASVDVGHWKYGASALLTERLAIQEQTIGVKGLQFGVVSNGHDQVALDIAKGAVRLRRQNAQQLIAKQRAGLRLAAGSLARCLGRRLDLIAGGDIDFFRAAMGLVGEDPVPFGIDVGLDVSQRDLATKHQQARDHQLAPVQFKACRHGPAAHSG